MLAGFPDGRAGEGVQAGAPTLVGLKMAQQRGETAPAYPDGTVPGAVVERDETDSTTDTGGHA